MELTDIRMTLKDFIEGNESDTKTRIYIGAVTNFFYIGYFNEAKKGVLKVDGIYFKKLRRTLSTLKKNLENAPANLENSKRRLNEALSVKKPDPDKVNSIKETISYYEKIIKYNPNKIKKLENQIITYTPFLNRRIKEVYKKTYPNEEGLAIIIEGNETGRYWNYSECKM